MADGSFTPTNPSALLRTVPMSLWPEGVRRRRDMLQHAAQRAERLLADIVEKLDAIDGDPDLEPSLGAGAWEITFAGFEYLTDDREMEETDQELGGLGDRTDQRRWAELGALEGDGEPDLEASLGPAAQSPDNQAITWETGACASSIARYGRQTHDIDDAEHDGREPEDEGGDLGWSEGETLTGNLTHQSREYEPSLSALGGTGDSLSPMYTRRAQDQRIWAYGGDEGHMHRDAEGEVQCEDQGAQCEGGGGEEGDEREPEAGDIVPTYHPEDQRRILSARFGDQVIYTDV